MLSLLLVALAQEAPTVLVSTFQPRNPEATRMASLLENFLAQELAASPEITVRRVDDMPRFEDYPARTYLDSCPPGDIQGCTYIVAERGEVDWAVTGSVRALVGTTKVTVDILDITTGRVIVSFETEVSDGNDEVFAQGVARVLVAAMTGEFVESDLRNTGDDGEEGDMRELSNDAVAAQLSELSKELGEMTAILSTPNQEIQRSDFTMDDLMEEMEGEGVKPWERLDMSPGEYLRYKNADMPLTEWKERAMGRSLQLLIRPYLGFTRGPVDGKYYARYVYGASSLTVVDSYSAQAVQTGSGVVGGATLAFGVHPAVDVGVTGGISTGHFYYYINQETEGEPILPSEEQAFQTSNWFVGPEVTAALMPTWSIRPVVGAGVLFWRTSSLSDKVDTQNLPVATFKAQVLPVAEGIVGAELRLSEYIDFYAQLPMQFIIGGTTFQDYRDSTQELLTDLDAPNEPSAFGVTARVGLQVRLGGKKVEENLLIENYD